LGDSTQAILSVIPWDLISKVADLAGLVTFLFTGGVFFIQPRPRVGFLAILETAGEDLYEAQHDGQRLRFRRWIDNRPQRGLLGFVTSPYQYELEMIDPAGETIWTFPSVSDLADLYQAIRFYEAGVGPYIDRLLAQP